MGIDFGYPGRLRDLKTATLVAVWTCLNPAPVEGQGLEGQRLAGQRWAPAGSADGILSTQGAESREAQVLYWATWASYALNPVVVTDADGDEVGSVVEHLMALDLVGSWALTESLEIGASLPLWMVRDGDPGFAAAEGIGLGDVALRLAYRLQLGYFTALALHLPVFLPTSSDDDVLSKGFGIRPTLAFSQRFGALQFLLNGSYLFRGDEQVLDYDGGDEVGLSAGLRWALDEPGAGQTSLVLEYALASAPKDFFAAAETPTELRGGAEVMLSDAWRLSGFAGTSTSTGVGSPDVRLGLGLAYAPEAGRRRPTPEDRDGDGVPNESDQCPDAREDADGFDDEDGCPDPDNDGDGVPDEDDACPTAPETINGQSDDDGCPDFVRLEDAEIVTLKPLYFDNNSTEVESRDRDMLREIAQIVRVNKKMKLRIAGHADSKGAARYNMKLSRKRAQSVKEALVREGADDGRVIPVGQGEGRPEATNATETGRARNRRVEFHIVWRGQ